MSKELHKRQPGSCRELLHLAGRARPFCRSMSREPAPSVHPFDLRSRTRFVTLSGSACAVCHQWKTRIPAAAATEETEFASAKFRSPDERAGPQVAGIKPFRAQSDK